MTSSSLSYEFFRKADHYLDDVRARISHIDKGAYRDFVKDSEEQAPVLSQASGCQDLDEDELSQMEEEPLTERS